MIGGGLGPYLLGSRWWHENGDMYLIRKMQIMAQARGHRHAHHLQMCCQRPDVNLAPRVACAVCAVLVVCVEWAMFSGRNKLAK